MRRLCGEYDQTGYRIFDGQTGEELYEAGNHPLDSQGSLPATEGLSLAVLQRYCEQTGRDLAKECGGRGVGCQQAQCEQAE